MAYADLEILMRDAFLEIRGFAQDLAAVMASSQSELLKPRIEAAQAGQFSCKSLLNQ